ncbi:OTU domain-containing protein 4-like [Lingula anatina]|uniref:OTU domain-containing protein 4-like n=1 Tax=Lingula anatina TaxID=7574 RepID=A0A1S3I1Z2_LINAN|nr:OTU domain-containing protein 4-like [Lingula anatina]|eukprot:XP_013392263.1 OTU domain-containing protein 4-like [Lingula anatina]
MFYIQQRKLIQRQKYISENAGIMKTTTRGEPLDRYLAELGLWRKSIAKDGFSLFRAVSEQLFLSQVYHVQVRDACVKYMSQYPAKFEHFIQGPYESHLRDLNQPKECAGHAEICALSLIYK